MSEVATEASVEAAVAAIRSGKPAVLPTDTVYGLCASPYRAEPVRALYALKGRDEEQPTALIAADFELLLECVPELRGRSAVIARALLPGPYTLILANPAHRFPWLTGARPETIGVRVPAFSGPGRAVLDQVGALAATSANRPGEPDPVTVDDVPDELCSACGAVVDGGKLPGVPSTVIDFTGPDPRIVREGAVSAAEALERIRRF
jgi:tRNA threonylcarbamoyl adenosine modification protein (Sua5/YciO/YrdC/YwlC family)